MKKQDVKKILRFAFRGGLLVGGGTLIVIIFFYLFAHGSGESGSWVLFAQLRALVGMPLYLLIGNESLPWPFNNIMTDDIFCLAINSLAGGLVSGLLAVAWDFVKKKEHVKSKTILLMLSALPFYSIAHEAVVHQHITMSAESLVAANSQGYKYFLSTITITDASGRLILPFAGDYRQIDGENGWMTVGSMREDAVYEDEGGVRPFNHFYNPLNGLGISDVPRIQGDMDQLYGRSSFDWAAWYNESGINVRWPLVNQNTHNEWSWQNVRQHEWEGLTNSSPLVRNAYLAQMFRGIGNIVHLLQDTSQPQHVRNEQHLDKILLFPSPYHSAIEEYGAAHWQELNYSATILDWRTVGFTQMRDFWDRDFYTGNAQALNEDASGAPEKKLGLAEFSNGNFIGTTASYAEYSTPGNKHYFPFPSLESSTDYRNRAHLAANLRTSYLKDGTPIQRIAISKIHDGITINNHSMLNYLGTKFPRYGGAVAQVFSTIDDPLVLQEYHENLIPKAVEYSAGLLDYFFRGSLAIVVNWDSDTEEYTIKVFNSSSQGFSGGALYLYSEDVGGTRTLVQQDSVGTLAVGTSKNIVYPGPVSQPTKFVLVYRGTIGPNPVDPVDAEIAIAVKRFTLEPDGDCPESESNCYPNCQWTMNESKEPEAPTKRGLSSWSIAAFANGVWATHDLVQFALNYTQPGRLCL